MSHWEASAVNQPKVFNNGKQAMGSTFRLKANPLKKENLMEVSVNKESLTVSADILQ